MKTSRNSMNLLEIAGMEPMQGMGAENADGIP
jgi:hypothetical protein